MAISPLVEILERCIERLLKTELPQLIQVEPNKFADLIRTIAIQLSLQRHKDHGSLTCEVGKMRLATPDPLRQVSQGAVAHRHSDHSSNLHNEIILYIWWIRRIVQL